ncbi:MAG: hypothetical protein CM1200mP20_02410 [Pseudomonadota bacterium]|nr:MAG: hypothetical protein CM1200mP20_02410 [Pseudomonadota bacterium]
MKFNLTRSDPTTLKTDCPVVGILAEGKLTPSAKKQTAPTRGPVRRLVRPGISRELRRDPLVPDLSSTTTQRLLLVWAG